MNLKKIKLLQNHIFCIGLLFVIVSVFLIVTGTIPSTVNYDLYGCFNLFMYFVVILGIICLCYSFIRFQLYQPIYKIIRLQLKQLKNKNVIKGLLINAVAFICIVFVSAVLETIYSRFFIGAPNSLGTYFNRYRFLFILTVLLIAFTLFKLRKQLLQHTERAFLVIALICGMLMIYSGHTNTSVSWDDHIHFNSTNSMIGLTEYSRTPMERLFYEDVMNEHYIFSTDFFNMRNYKDHQQLYVDIDAAGESVVSPISYTSFIQKICYLPAALFLAIGRLLNLPFYLRYMFGELGNLLLYSFAIYFAIKKLNCGKMLVAGIALIPTNIFLATNYSCDTWITALSILGFAYFYSEMQSPDKKISPMNAVIIIVSLFLALTPKAVYFPLMALLYLMPKKKFNNQTAYRRYIIAVTLAIIYLLLSFVIPSIISGPSTDVRGGADVNGAAQVSYILHNPLEYTKTLLSFLKRYLSIGSTNGYTTNMAYYGIGSKYIAVTTLIALYAFLDRTNAVGYTSKIWHRFFTTICCLAAICLVATALYVAYTPVGLDSIGGCQPRYIIPLIFPFLSVLGSAKSTGYFTKNWHYIISFSLSSYLLLATFWTTCIGLYY